jgi:hypothetical protein
MGKKSKKEVVKAPVYGRPPAGTSNKCVITFHKFIAMHIYMSFRLEIKFDPEKIGNFVTGFAKVRFPFAACTAAGCQPVACCSMIFQAHL